MILNKLALQIQCSLHPTYLSRMGSIVPHSPSSFTIIFVSHGVSLFLNEVQKLSWSTITSHHKGYTSLYLFFSFILFCFVFFFPHLFSMFIFFLLLFLFVIDTIKVQTPSMSRSDMRQGSIVSYIIHHITICIIFFLNFSASRLFITFFDN